MSKSIYGEIIWFILKYEDMDYAEIKNKMRKIRKQKGYTRKEIVESGLFTTGSLSMVEKLSYPYKPSIENLIKYCDAIDITLKELYEVEVGENERT